MPSPRSPLSIAPDHDAAGAPLTSWYTQGVTDGFGDRLLMFDNAATGPVELLRVRPDFAVVPGFESALRARFEQLSSFTHPSFAQARVVNHLENGGGLTVASTHVTGTRLSELFVTTRPRPGMHPASVRDAFGDLVAAIAELHRRGRNVAHGALGAERILLTFERQLVVTDYVFGEALERLNLSQEQLWTEFGLVGDPASGRTRLDQRGDLAQLGLLMLSLVIGRRVSPREYPHKMGVLLSDFSTASDRRAPEATEPLRAWLEQALDTEGFRSADEAERAFLIRPRRPHSINLQIPLPKGLTEPRVAAPAQTAQPTPAEPVSSATAPPMVATTPSVVASAVPDVAPAPASSGPAPIDTRPEASTRPPAATASPLFVPAPLDTPLAPIEPPPSAIEVDARVVSPPPVDSTLSQATTPSPIAATAPLWVSSPPAVDSPHVAAPSLIVPTPPALAPPVVESAAPPTPIDSATPFAAVALEMATASPIAIPQPRCEAEPLVAQPVPMDAAAPIAPTPLQIAIPSPIATPPPRFEAEPLVAPPIPIDVARPIAPTPLQIAIPSPIATPPPRFEAEPFVASPTLAPAADVAASLSMLLRPPREVPPAPDEPLPVGFLRLQSNEAPTAASSILDLLMLPAAPPIAATPPVAEAPAAPAPIQRPEPFSWISDRQPGVDADAVTAGATRSVPTMSWLTVALAILVVTQAAIIGRLLARQSAAPTTETVSASAPDKTVLNSAPTGAAPADLPQDRQTPVVPVLPAAAQPDPAQAGTTRAASQPGAAETSAPVQSAGAASRNLGGVQVISPIPLQVMLGDRFLGSSARGPVFATAGTRELDFVNDQLGFRVRQRVFIYADRVVPLRINPPNGSLIVTAQPAAQVWIDGHLAGDTPLTTSVPIGEHEVIFQNTQYGIKRQKTVVQVGSPTEVSASFTP